MSDEWIYNGQPITETELIGYTAFVYIIRDCEANKSYIGKKRLQFVRHTRRKGSKRRVKHTRPSDWQNYWGSNEELLNRVKQLGVSHFTRTILRLCRSLSESNYYELKEQMITDALLKPEEYYNAYVGSRISRRQMGIKT